MMKKPKYQDILEKEALFPRGRVLGSPSKTGMVILASKVCVLWISDMALRTRYKWALGDRQYQEDIGGTQLKPQ
jgi:hypothetical protein